MSMKDTVKVSHSTKRIRSDLLIEISNALKKIRWGSIEIYVQDSQVVQITERSIKKVNGTSSDNAKKRTNKKLLHKNGS